MRLQIAVLAAALALAAGCDNRSEKASPAPRADTPPPKTQATTPTTPANIGQPKTEAEKKDGTNPVQGQVDPKQSEQREGFKQKGDAAGPSSPDTKPKTGG